MVMLRRDTAWRSLQDFFKALPPEANVEVVKVGRPPRGSDLAVKLEIAADPTASTPVEVKTAAGPRSKPARGKDSPRVKGPPAAGPGKGGTDANIQGH